METKPPPDFLRWCQECATHAEANGYPSTARTYRAAANTWPPALPPMTPRNALAIAAIRQRLRQT